MFLINSRYPLFTAAIASFRERATSPAMAGLLASLRPQFAEFLNWSSSTRLRILSSSTCVGLRYGLAIIFLRSFSGKHRITGLAKPPKELRSGITSQAYGVRIFLHATLRAYTTTTKRVAHATFLRHSIGQTMMSKYGNINPLPIDYAFRPRLRIRLTLGGVTWPRNPWIFGGRDSHTPYRYSF